MGGQGLSMQGMLPVKHVAGTCNACQVAMMVSANTRRSTPPLAPQHPPTRLSTYACLSLSQRVRHRWPVALFRPLSPPEGKVQGKEVAV
jgi:hypothetical protein